MTLHKPTQIERDMAAHYAAVRQRILNAAPKTLQARPIPDRGPGQGLPLINPAAAPIVARYRVIACPPLLRDANAHVAVFRANEKARREGGVIAISVARIKADFRAVCPLDWLEIVSHRRKRVIVVWRQALTVALLEHTSMSLPRIGREVGGFDHTTVLHAKRVVDRDRGNGTARRVVGPTGIVFWVRTP